MAAGASALAGPDNPPSGGPSGQTPPSRLAGDFGQGSPDPQGPDQGFAQIIQQLGEMRQAVEDMASRFPAAAAPLRNAVASLSAASRAIQTNPGSPEPAAPQIGG